MHVLINPHHTHIDIGNQKKSLLAGVAINLDCDILLTTGICSARKQVSFCNQLLKADQLVCDE